LNSIAYLRHLEPDRNLPAPLVLAMDVGGTKTLAAVADTKGQVVALARGGGANYQSIGLKPAKSQLVSLTRELLDKAGATPQRIAWSAFAVAGADRNKDFFIISDLLKEVLPGRGHVLTNDTLAALWAESPDGTGLALVSGTGTNCIGVNSRGVVAKVGGFGPFSGDIGYAENIAYQAFVAVFMHLDGRSPATVLREMFQEALGVEALEDFCEFYFADSYNPPNLGSLAPLVFKAANQGDRVALRIINTCARAMGRSAHTALKRLGYGKDDAPLVALGGSILQKPEPPLLTDALIAAIKARHPRADIRMLHTEPVSGVVFLALTELAGKNLSAAVRSRVVKTVAGAAKTL